MALRQLSSNILSSLRQSGLNSNVSFKHSAIIFKGSSKIISVGHNCERNCIHGAEIGTEHAELSAIMKILRTYSAQNALRMGADNKWYFLRKRETKTEDGKV